MDALVGSPLNLGTDIVAVHELGHVVGGVNEYENEDIKCSDENVANVMLMFASVACAWIKTTREDSSH